MTTSEVSEITQILLIFWKNGENKDREKLKLKAAKRPILK